MLCLRKKLLWCLRFYYIIFSLCMWLWIIFLLIFLLLRLLFLNCISRLSILIILCVCFLLFCLIIECLLSIFWCWFSIFWCFWSLLEWSLLGRSTLSILKFKLCFMHWWLYFTLCCSIFCVNCCYFLSVMIEDLYWGIFQWCSDLKNILNKILSLGLLYSSSCVLLFLYFIQSKSKNTRKS